MVHKEICAHEKIYVDEPRDLGGAYYRCLECREPIPDVLDWEWEHDRNWDWYEEGGASGVKKVISQE